MHAEHTGAYGLLATPEAFPIPPKQSTCASYCLARQGGSGP